MAEQFRRTRLDRADGGAAGPGEVPCDVCAAEKLRAVKSCLVCLASYCDEHVQPHYQGAAFRTHRLTEPVSHLKHKLCKRHERLLELFCTTDRTCICQFCAESDHRTHSIVPLEEECRARKARRLNQLTSHLPSLGYANCSWSGTESP
uniref:B box-type domain-containing protein n=1 Tax=Lepisosteus oculatus TaxID=7918 RepID=W5M486_LEPOC